VNESIKEPARI